jgi:hypothetical protein
MTHSASNARIRVYRCETQPPTALSGSHGTSRVASTLGRAFTERTNNTASIDARARAASMSLPEGVSVDTSRGCARVLARFLLPRRARLRVQSAR